MSAARIRVLAVGSAVLLTIAFGVGAATMLAAPTSLAGIQASSTVNASRYAFWLAQVNHAGVCGMISGCVGSSGSSWKWNLRRQFETPTGVQEVPATVRVIKQMPFRLLKLRVKADTVLGDVDSVVSLTLRGRSPASTRVTLRVNRMTATGLASSYTDDFAEALQPYLTARAQAINGELAATGAKVKLQLSQARRPTAKVKVTTARLTPTAASVSGRAVIYIADRAVCSGKLTASRARCSFVAPKSRADVLAVVRGTLDDNTPVWTTGKARYRP